MAGAELRLDPLPSSVPAARRWLRQALEFDGRFNVDTVSLLLSELTTNALMHARSPVTVRAFERGDLLRIEVTDAGTTPTNPQQRIADAEGESGRGLHVVAMLADRWGFEQNPGGPGVTVWFELDAGAQPGTTRSVGATG